MAHAQVTEMGDAHESPKGRLRVEAYTGTAEEWDRFAERQEGYTHYHKLAWRGLMKRVFRHDGVYLAARDDSGALAGVLPLIRIRSAIFGRQLCSMPFLNYGGPIGSEEAIRALTAAAEAEAARDGTKTIEFRSRRQLPIDLPCSTHKITVTINLSDKGSDDFWKSLPSAVRNQVRKPQKAGVTMRFGADQAGPFFQVFARNMRDLGTPTHPRRLFEEIAKEFPDDAIFGCAYVGDTPVAGGCAIKWGTEIEMVWGSALREYNKTHAPNMLMYWSFMERACAMGMTVFNFGRCTADEGTHRFKRQWGGQDEPLYWYGPHVNDLAQGSTAERIGPKVWRYLPLSIANLIGPYVRRGISA